MDYRYFQAFIIVHTSQHCHTTFTYSCELMLNCGIFDLKHVYLPTQPSIKIKEMKKVNSNCPVPLTLGPCG